MGCTVVARLLFNGHAPARGINNIAFSLRRLGALLSPRVTCRRTGARDEEKRLVVVLYLSTSLSLSPSFSLLNQALKFAKLNVTPGDFVSEFQCIIDILRVSAREFNRNLLNFLPKLLRFFLAFFSPTFFSLPSSLNNSAITTRKVELSHKRRFYILFSSTPFGLFLRARPVYPGPLPSTPVDS